MTNHAATLGPDPAADAVFASLAHVGWTRRPVKIVQHPAFRGHLPRPALASSRVVLPLRVVSLDPVLPLSPIVAADPCPCAVIEAA
jgi:hypothetical protein